jgi:hypothetical protein
VSDHLAQLSSPSAGLVTAKGDSSLDHGAAVNTHGTRLNARGDTQRAVDILGEDSSGQAKLRLIGLENDVFLISEFPNDQNWAENFFP